MPKKRPRTTIKAQWSSDTLLKAEILIKHGKSIRYAAKVLSIPFSSLQARLKNKDSSEPRLGRRPVFTKDEENELANRIKCLSAIFYGCTITDIGRAAYWFAENYQIKHNFDSRSKMAGREWLDGFLKRNSISVRKSKATSINRTTALNKTDVQLFFTLLEDFMTKYKFDPKNIFTCDETSISYVEDSVKLSSVKNVKRVGSTMSTETERDITLLCSMSATGGFVPPMVIYPRKNQISQIENNGPAGATYKYSDNGCINENLFIEWLQHFAYHTKPSPQEPILLICDNHSSHISLPIFDFCRENNIHILSFPTHSSHRMQPLELTFFGPLKAAYKDECNSFIEDRLCDKKTVYNFAALLNRAYSSVAIMNKGDLGFQAAGIFPFNPQVLSEDDYRAPEALNSPK